MKHLTTSTLLLRKLRHSKLCEEFRKRTKEIHDQISKLTCLEFTQ